MRHVGVLSFVVAVWVGLPELLMYPAARALQMIIDNHIATRLASLVRQTNGPALGTASHPSVLIKRPIARDCTVKPDGLQGWFWKADPWRGLTAMSLSLPTLLADRTKSQHNLQFFVEYSRVSI
jgi:hypothetical protein